MKTVLITGISSGIGLKTTEYFLQRNFLVFASVRKKSDLQVLRKKLKSTRLILLCFDVTDQQGLNRAYKKVKKTLSIWHKEKLDYLINNAGIICRAPLLLEKSNDFLQQIQVNLCGTYLVTKTFLPLLQGIPENPFKGSLAKKSQRSRSGGRVIIVNSINGKIALPLQGAYCASKFALIGLAESWDLELRIYGVRVISILPGPIDTQMRHKVNREDMDKISKSDYGPRMDLLLRNFIDHARNRIAPEKVATKIYRACTSLFPASSYVITPHPFFYWWLPSLLPKVLRDHFLKI